MSATDFTEHFDISAQGTLAENAEVLIELSTDIYDPNAHPVTLLSIDIAIAD